MTLDIKFLQDENGDWDFGVYNGGIMTTDSLDSAVYMSIFGEKRATSDQVPNVLLRRGAVINELNEDSNYQIGSLLWLKSNQKFITSSVIEEIRREISDSLSWMIDQDITNKIIVDISYNNKILEIGVNLISKLDNNNKYYSAFLKLTNESSK